MKIYVVAKQWMWKAEYPGGQREINALHVPVNKPVELVMTSQDVIHDFFVPAFRVKRDVLPGQYETLWFQADRPGTYHLFCAQFCGTRPCRDGRQRYGDGRRRVPATGWRERQQRHSCGAEGKQLFIQYGCSGCHNGHGTVRAPSLAGLYGCPVPLSDGSTVIADDTLHPRFILTPGSQVVASYEPVMPSFAGVIGEDDLLKLVAYINSLGRESSHEPCSALRERIAVPQEQESYLSDGVSLRSWLLTPITSGSRSSTWCRSLFFFVGGGGRRADPLQLIMPRARWPQPRPTPAVHDARRHHGVVLPGPAVPATLGNFLVPLMIGARDLAFPRLNLLSWYLFMVGGICALCAMFAGGVDTGWTFYTPLQQRLLATAMCATVARHLHRGILVDPDGPQFHRHHSPAARAGPDLVPAAALLWSITRPASSMVLATPVLAITLLLLAFERIFHVGVFDPALGGDPLLFQHLFWFYSHPAVYIMILPGLGVVSEIIPAFSRKELFGYRFVAWSSVAITAADLSSPSPRHT